MLERAEPLQIKKCRLNFGGSTGDDGIVTAEN
jgi:hypothetical protein